MPDIHIKYTTSIEEPRPGIYGTITRFMGKHPLLSGFVAGLAVVLYAALSSAKGVLNEPEIATILGLIVIFVWTTLFFVMRAFFKRQSFQTTPLNREIILTDTEFTWKESGQILKTIHKPTLSILAEPVPPALLTTRTGRDTPTLVWLFIHDPTQPETDTNTQFTLQTRITAQEAATYPTTEGAITRPNDEELPINFASPLLMIIRQENQPQ